MIKKFNAHLVALTEILSDGKFHAGDAIGKTLGISRNAVWKNIKKLQNYGITIHSLKGKGYVMREELILLEPDLIKKKLLQQEIELCVIESITSTNTYLKDRKNNKKMSICLAECQTQGKGRFDRTWHSPFAQNIYLSCLYPLRKEVSELAGLGLITSLAVIRALKELQIEARVKWPNDVMIQNKKISGSLIEIQAETHGLCHAIIGVGLNVNMSQVDPNAIKQNWTSIKDILGQAYNRNDLCAALINHLLLCLQQFERQGFSSFLQEWQAVDNLIGQTIELNSLQGKVRGQMFGINEHGQLLMQQAGGVIQAFSSGDTSLV